MPHMPPKTFYIYMMASVSGTLYTGVTNDLIRRTFEHRTGLIEGFTKEYGCRKLVYFETFATAPEAIDRETQIKKWRREKKERLIRMRNSGWRDLWDTLF